MKATRIVCVLCVLATCAQSALACWPRFPIGYLYNGSEAELLRMPEAVFAEELNRIAGTRFRCADRTYRQADMSNDTLDADLKDLRKALASREAEGVPIEAVVHGCGRLRRAMMGIAESPSNEYHSWSVRDVPSIVLCDAREDQTEECGPACSTGQTLSLRRALMVYLPREFSLYLQGASAYHDKQYRQAIQLWEALLQLPEEQRRFRSTWASFMIGKAWLHVEPEKAIPHFVRTRELAKAGFEDSLSLAPSSLGWQAMAMDHRGDTADAMRLYIQMYELGPGRERGIAYESLGIMAEKVLCSETVPAGIVEDPYLVRIISAKLAARDYEPYFSDGWHAALRGAGCEVPPGAAGYMASSAYRAGRMDEARRWANAAGDASPFGRLVRAKLDLRDGDVDQAIEQLQSLVSEFPRLETRIILPDSMEVEDREDLLSTARAESGVLLMGRQKYLAALDALVKAGVYIDAAYVAERVLTINELRDYISSRESDAKLMETRERRFSSSQKLTVLTWLKHLHARRLAREGRFEEALAYYPKEALEMHWDDENPTEIGPKCQLFLEELNKARDRSLPGHERAEHYLAAANTMRESGMEIIGSECEPDWFLNNGMLTFKGAMYYRVENSLSPLEEEISPKAIAALSASADEKRRARRHVVNPEKRFHYRYRAADLMWEGAKLTPDNDPLTARALYEGGTLLQYRDPQSADRFYKALVRRCRKLAIGQKADELRWFPKEVTDEDYRPAG